ncbi:MAG: hypothetical protein K5697_06810 [Lachnospiraceae bacterium]|nr:hypothetical protein [Lachnospiraceae bacterium]
MGKFASEEAIENLQKIFDFLGKYGGAITTKNPTNWWKLYVDTDLRDDGRIATQIGIHSDLNGDTIFDPIFRIAVTWEDDKIKEVEIFSCEETTVFGTSVVDADDMISMSGIREKDEYGLVERFDSFMHNMAEVGPYLRDPEKVVKYDSYLSE